MPESRSEENNYIEIKGAEVHNLKCIDLKIPRDELVVITGLSGSGKSSLAFDTLYAEGQRRYVESLSSYARQFLGRIDKPAVEYIHGIPPAIAIEQRVNSRNPRSTVGTSTEIYDYLKLLYARIGRTYSPVSGKEVKRHTVTDVVDYLLSKEKGGKYLIMTPFLCCDGPEVDYQLDVYLKQGITRIEIDDEVYKIEDIISDKNLIKRAPGQNLVIDRIIIKNDADTLSRYADSIQTAFSIGKGSCIVKAMEMDDELEFSDRFDLDGMQFDLPTEHLFSFNNPVGACPVCEGYGQIIGIDEDLVIPNRALSIYEEAIVCWKGEKMSKWKDKLIQSAELFNFPIHKPIYDLSDDERKLLWTGNKHFKGLNKFFQMLEEKKYKIQYRVMLSRYRGKTMCYECNGTRLRKEATWVKINKVPITDLVKLPIDKLHEHFEKLKINKHEEEIAGRLLVEIKNRVGFLLNVGLSYLSLNRLSSSLSGGESQRINLATSLGSSLVGSLYILDEPSIGLHSRDTLRLIQVLSELKDIGNTLVVVEHDEEIMKSADTIIDIGPGAGRNGGEVVFIGSPADLFKAKNSLTSKYLRKEMMIPVPSYRRSWNDYIEIIGARENNLKNISVKFPLNTITVVSGVSGSGKTSLISNILYSALSRKLNGSGTKLGKFDKIQGDLHRLKQVEFVDQNPIGKSSRSNPVTYLKAFDEIRKLFADQQASTQSGFNPSHFSFNVEGGRCEECQGEGTIKVEMQFMADVNLLCESCHGRRYKDDVLEVKYRSKSIYDVLEMTVNEAIEFFSESEAKVENRIVTKLQPLQDVGLGYVKLGQSSSTLSGGESQRVKLAFFLSKEGASESVFFIFDEPTTGLHFHDINKLLDAFNALIKKGHSILIIEHNMEIIKTADWVIDIGPEGGDKGGEIVFEGTPEDLINCKKSYTGKFLKEKLVG
ncbi:MAG: excinuclease ABC subunit UvrA [Bacteroidales bacterium]|nr:excinuclease ABC subunit UvrA [Bacteroidales bacterium]